MLFDIKSDLTYFWNSQNVEFSRLTFLDKVFRSVYLRGNGMYLVDTMPAVRYWSEVLRCAISTHFGVKVTDLETLC